MIRQRPSVDRRRAPFRSLAAATLATQVGLLGPGEAPAMILGALVTVAVAALAGGAAGRHQVRQTRTGEGSAGESRATGATG